MSKTLEPEDSWKTPIDVVRKMVEKWDESGKLPKPQLDAEGNELVSSVLRRVVVATAAEKASKNAPPRTGPFRAKSMSEETPAMQDYLRACSKRAAELTGQLYTGPEPAPRKPIWDKDVELWNAEMEAAFHLATPSALRQMGLQDLEINLLPELEQRWGAVAAVNMFLPNDKRFLVLGGESRSGKTIAAASALLSCVDVLRTTEGRVQKRWVKRGAFVKAHELSRLGNYGSERLVWEPLERKPLLIIDDLGSEHGTEFWKDNLLSLLDARMRREAKTIITTNLSGKQLRALYDERGERIIARLTEAGDFVKCMRPAEPVAP